MKSLTYTGTQPYNATIRVKDATGKLVLQDVRLSPGEDATVDETHAAIKPLIAKGLLVDPAPVQPAKKTTSSTN